jgi:bifunctional UDP-N-acetylglucosamine pyrophosphorylase / glucosamine-1-phosphate N-acetyltransferase
MGQPPLSIVIMAAGKGTRMKSARPKVLHTLAGRSLLHHVLNAVAGLRADRTVVIAGHEAAQVEAAVSGVVCVRQEPQLGTGHAVQQAVPALPDAGTVLVLNGDVPLIAPSTVQRLVEASGGTRLALLTITLDDPFGYGRVVRGEAQSVLAIVEQKDATEAQRTIRETYTGVMAAPAAWLKRAVMALSNDNAQKEYYLTDLVCAAVRDGIEVASVATDDAIEVAGVNDPLQLATLERAYQRREAERLMRGHGLRLSDPARFDLRGTLRCGSDVSVDVGCVFEGEVELGDGVSIGAHCVIRNTRIAAGAQVQPFTLMDNASIGEGAIVGPFARLRPGADLGAEVHIGNFVEVKNSTLGKGSKANHLAYLGDATVGERVNYGAGSITANYDGANKHRTVIGNDVHVGSNCVLVAPMTVGDGATIGGGSTVTKEAPAGQLTLARAKQVTMAGWKRPAKKKP